MTVEEKALALLNEVRAEWNRTPLVALDRKVSSAEEALYRAIEREQAAIEAHEADKKAFSEAITAFWPTKPAPEHFRRFILPEPEPDLLVEEIKKAAALIGQSITDVQAANITFYFAARGYKIERIDQ